MSKTTFNRIENNMREAFDEDISALEQALGVSREELTKHTIGANFHNTNGKNYINQQQNFADKETITSLKEEIRVLRQREDKLLSMIADMNGTISELLKKITCRTSLIILTIWRNLKKTPFFCLPQKNEFCDTMNWEVFALSEDFLSKTPYI